jgi:hypothetical protein
MNSFEYAMVLISIVIGLGITLVAVILVPDRLHFVNDILKPIRTPNWPGSYFCYTKQNITG